MMLRILFIFLLTAVTAIAGSLDEARGLIEEERFEEARPLLEKALKNSAAEAEALLLLTRVCNAMEDWESGVKYGKRAVKLLPDETDAHYQYAVALRMKMSNVGKTRAMFTIGSYKKGLKTAISLDPTNVDALTERIGFLINAPGIAGGDLDEAEKEVVKLEKIDWLVAKQMQLGIEMKREDILGAIKVSEEILKRHPDHAGTRSALGYLLQRNDQFKEADVQFAQLVESEDKEVAMAALYQRGRTRVLGNFQLDEAITMFETYIERLGAGFSDLPSEAAALWRIGLAYQNLGQLDHARGAYESALEIEPDFKEARQSLKKLK